jgi:hypothetical protein
LRRSIKVPELLCQSLVGVSGELPQGRDALVDGVQPKAEESRPKRRPGLLRLHAAAHHFGEDLR